MAHTPGPWKFAGECEPIGGRDDDRAGTFQVWQDTEHGRTIAEVVSSEDSSIGASQGSANARLIAAAPTLLEACQMTLQMPTPCIGQSMSTQTAQDIQIRLAIVRNAVWLALTGNPFKQDGAKVAN